MDTTIPPGPQLQGRFDTLLRTCRDKVLVYTDAQLTDLFNNADQALLDFADKAESNQMQGRFFDAMNEVRKKNSLVEHAFREQVKSAFDHFGQSNRADFSSAAYGGVDIEEMSLLAHDDLDESVVIGNIIAKARDAYNEKLYALSQRLAVINGGRKLKEWEIPSGPHHLVGAFQSAARELEVDPMIKLILFALFEKYVLKQAKSIYDAFNDDLIAAGILPHLKPAFQHRAQNGTSHHGPTETPQGFQHHAQNGTTHHGPTETPRGFQHHAQNGTTHHGPTETPQGFQHHAHDGATAATIESDEAAAKVHEDAYTQGSTQNLGEELLSSIFSLMAVQRSHHRTDRRNVPAHPVSTATVVSAIESIQPAGSTYTNGAGYHIDALPHPEADRVFRGKIRGALVKERKRLFMEVNRDQMDAVDADTIDLVGMLFQYMLDDPVLPNVAKALISHLHTPYLKVAIIDRQLLTDDKRPARSLLDELIEAGSEWVYEHDLNRGIFPAMKMTVARVLEEFSNDVRLFDEFLVDFRIAVEKQKRQAGTLEKRSQEAAKQREELHIAKQRAAQEMKLRAQRRCLPQVAADFLTQSWTDKLIFTLLRHPDGEFSGDWTEALRIADDLVRVFEPKTSSAERRALVKVLCLLRESIEDGLKSLGPHQDQCAALFQLLESPESLLAHQEVLEQDADSKRIPGPLPAQEPQPTTQTAATESASRTRTREELTPMQEAVPQWLREVKFGTWFEFRDRDSGKPLRLKLSWASPVTSTCMFVDSSGAQAAVMSLPELAKEITGGRAKLVEGSKKPFIARTLESIRNILQRSTAQAS